jgi:hypothetical protein
VEKAMAKAHLNTILALQNALQVYVKKFEDTKAEITLVAKKIYTITNIWQTVIKSECVDLSVISNYIKILDQPRHAQYHGKSAEKCLEKSTN